MTEKYITELERGHIRGQAVTYFGIALLLMGSIHRELKPVTPSIGLNLHLPPIPFPLPSIDLGYWPVLIIDLVILVLSLFFMASLFITPWLRLAMRVSRLLKFPILVLLPMTFFIGAAKGLVILGDVYYPWFVIFAWTAILLVLALETHLIIDAITGLRPKKPIKLKRGEHNPE